MSACSPRKRLPSPNKTGNISARPQTLRCFLPETSLYGYMIERSYEHHPVDDIEPEVENWRRECAERGLVLIYAAMLHIQRAESMEIGWHGVAFALDMISDSMTDVAAKLGVERATISHSARQFCRNHGLPTPNSLRSEKASASYRQTRKSQCKTPTPKHK